MRPSNANPFVFLPLFRRKHWKHDLNVFCLSQSLRRQKRRQIECNQKHFSPGKSHRRRRARIRRRRKASSAGGGSSDAINRRNSWRGIWLRNAVQLFKSSFSFSRQEILREILQAPLRACLCLSARLPLLGSALNRPRPALNHMEFSSSRWLRKNKLFDLWSLAIEMIN